MTEEREAHALYMMIIKVLQDKSIENPIGYLLESCLFESRFHMMLAINATIFSYAEEVEGLDLKIVQDIKRANDAAVCASLEDEVERSKLRNLVRDINKLNSDFSLVEVSGKSAEDIITSVKDVIKKLAERQKLDNDTPPSSSMH